MSKFALDNWVRHSLARRAFTELDESVASGLRRCFFAPKRLDPRLPKRRALATMRSMPADNLLRMGAIGLLFGYPCVFDDLGEHPGSVCSGPEVSLSELSPGRSLAGWWTLIDDGEEDGQSWDWPYLQIDEGDHPRALIFEEPENFDKRSRSGGDFTFGCQDYLDYPLVPGSVNRAPARSQTTIPDASCGTTRYSVGADSRRALKEVQRVSNRICYNYRMIRKHNDDERGEEEMGRPRIFCFGYDRAEDRLIVSYTGSSKEQWTHYYERRQVPGESFANTGSSQEANGDAHLETAGARP